MKKIFTLLILLLLLPLAAWAQETNVPYIYYTWDDVSQILTQHDDGTAETATVVTDQTTWSTGWYVVNSNITINSRVTVTGHVHLILADGCKLTASNGIEVSKGNSLTIYGQTNGSGALEATGYSDNAGIGGGNGSDGGTVTIHGGTVSAESVRPEGAMGSGAGIGGGGGDVVPNGSDGTVTIYGGEVTAISDRGAGIGGGGGRVVSYGSGGTVTIYGGEVTAISRIGAGIGGGGGGDISGGSGGKVTIHGGTVNATSNSGAGIGGGGGRVISGGSGGTVTIYGGEVTATSDRGAGIGGGRGDYISGGSGSFSTGTNGNAFIIASSDTGDAISDQSGNSNWSGVIFEGDAGAVYGSPTLQTDATIPAGKTLTIENGKTLTIGEGVTLTNNGTIIVYGELKGDVKGEGSIPITGITLDQTTLSLVKGETATATLQATIKPSIATDKDLTWSSSDSDVATVKNGEVTAVAVGKTDITVTTQDGGYTATCEVTVKQHTHSLTKTDYKAPTCTEDGNIEYWTCSVCGKYFSDEAGTTEISLDETVIYATGHHYVNGTCTECGEKDPDYRPDPISYYNIYVEDVCEGVDITTSKNVVREGGTISLYVEKDTANYTFDNFQVYYKRSYYGPWEVLEEGVQPGEYPINNIWTHIYIKAEGAEEKEDDPTGMEQVEGVKVYTKDGSLYVQTPQRETVIIVTMSGAVVKNEEQIGLKQYHGLQPGIYIVRVGDRAYKLRLH